MRKTLNILGIALNKLQDIVLFMCGALLLVMCLIIPVQVFFRYCLGSSLAWSEELTRYMFVWIIFLGINIGIRDGIQMKIDILDMFLKGKSQKVINIVRDLLSMVIVIACIISSMALIKVGMKTNSPTLHAPMHVIYLAFPVGFGLSAIELVRRMFLTLCGWNDTDIKGGEQQ